jgi:hypothetical protein
LTAAIFLQLAALEQTGTGQAAQQLRDSRAWYSCAAREFRAGLGTGADRAQREVLRNRQRGVVAGE